MKEQARRKKRIWITGLVLLALLLLVATSTVMAVDTDGITKVLKKNRDIFHTNTIVGGMLRFIGWQLITLLVWLAEHCAKLFDESFKFIDFTRYEPVEEFLDSWQPVVYALISLSILFLGLILIFWQEKKPKLMMNICLAVLIITSSGYLIDQLNGFVTDDIRSAIMNDGDTTTGSSGLIYDMVGASVYDLIYIDDKLDGGLMKMTKQNRKLYDDFTKEDLELLSINEVLKPDDVKAESKDLVSNRIYYRKDDLQLKEIYNGVAWTDLLNEYYYRYDVEWYTVIVGLVSMIIVYVCLAYKVVRILYEVVVQRLLAALYSANLTSSQKTLKILDSIKDSYITLILVMVCLKIYLLAFKMVGETGFGEFSKVMVLLFVAFAVVDGPNIIQKLTGVDAGLSSGMGKMIAGVQAMRMAAHMASRGVEAARELFPRYDKNEQVAGAVNAAAQSDLEGTKEAQGEVPPEETSSTNQDMQQKSADGSETDTPPDMQSDGEQVSDMPEAADIPESSGYAEDVSQDAFTAEADAMEGFNSGAMDDLNGLDPLSGNEGIGNGTERMNRMDQELSSQKEKRFDAGLHSSRSVEHQDLFFIYGQPLTSNALAAGNPFHFSSLQDPCGDFLGKTPCGGNVLFDEFHKSKTRRFYNSLAVGTMGSGKSTLLKKRFLTNAIKGNYVRTFDISGEFTTLTKTLGGKVLKLDGTNGILNPLEVLKAEEGEEISFTRHISKVSTIYKFLTEGSADTEEVIEFEELLRELYKTFGMELVGGKVKSQVTGLPANRYPTFSDLLAYIEGKMEEIQRKSKAYEAVELDLVKHRMAIMDKIRRVLSNITNTYGSLFDGHTSIDNILDEQIVTFDLSTIKEMKPSVFDAQIFNMISLCWDNCVTNGKLMMERLRKAKGEEGALDPEQVTKFLMIIDESHRWINTKKRHALESISIYLREARKFFGGIMLASQSIRDYVPEGSGAEEIDDLKKIFELTQYKFIFHQEADTLPLLDKVFENTLTQSQRNKIPKLEIGENILCIASDRNLEFKVHLTKEEDRIFEGGV